MPGGQLRQEGGGRVVLVVLLRLVTGFGIEPLQQNTDVFVELVPVPAGKKSWDYPRAEQLM